MSTTTSAQTRIDIAAEYFRRVDNGDATLFDLMTDDVQVYFPKFGTGYGKDEFAESAKGLLGSLKSIAHDMERMTYHVSGDHVIVEGFEGGVTAEGVEWPVPGRSEGRFCNVFEFEGELIKRVHVYVDPDFASTHTERFLWGDNVRMTRK